MRVVIQRVKSSSVEINLKIKSEIEKGLLVLVGILTVVQFKYIERKVHY